MDPILKKMNFKEGMKIQVWNFPEELKALINTWNTEGLMVNSGESPGFLLAFVQSEEEVKTFFQKMLSLTPQDEVLWMAYPKGSSKKYKASIHRDSGWKFLGENDFEPVRQVAIDEDWSAFRFRRIANIKVMTRKFSTKDQ